MDGLPKSYLVKQRRDQMNNICHVTRTPGTAEGVQTSFNYLLKERIKDHLVSHPDDPDDKNKNIWGWGQDDNKLQFYFAKYCPSTSRG